MEILKKIAGVLLLLFAGLLTIATLYSSVNSINDCIDRFHNSSDGVGFLIGTIIGIGIFITAIYFSTKFGLKLLRKKQISPEESIEEIGN